LAELSQLIAVEIDNVFVWIHSKGSPMANITLRRPPRITQSLQDSCWAAVIESWSQVESRIPRQQEQFLIDRWGEGETGGITTPIKIPPISTRFGLIWQVLERSGIGEHLSQHLPAGHIFCAYSVRSYLHSVLVYQFLDEERVVIMDPRQGTYRWLTLNWLHQQRSVLMMRTA
jgi:hypothetical protein